MARDEGCHYWFESEGSSWAPSDALSVHSSTPDLEWLRAAPVAKSGLDHCRLRDYRVERNYLAYLNTYRPSAHDHHRHASHQQGLLAAGSSPAGLTVGAALARLVRC